MALICIPPKVTEKLKAAVSSGDINISKLYDMTSSERRDLFAGHSDASLGKFINTEFEKAMVSNQRDAFSKWANTVFTSSDKTKPAFKTVMDKINNLHDMGVLTPSSEKAFLQDLVSDKLGLNVTPEEVKGIAERATKIDEAQQKLAGNIGDPTKVNENLAFFEAKADMDKYLQGLNPAHKLQVATGTIGRGMMLFSVKSPLLNIGSNIEVGTTEALVRRIVGHNLKGADNGLARDYVKMANKIYQKTGYDITRMTSLADGGVSGERVLGDTTHAEGKGATRAVGRVIEDTVFKQMMGAPDVVFAGVHFADSVNLGAMQLAKGDAAKALMADAMKLEPITEKGQILRAQAILDAQTATWTNKTWASQVSEGIRKILNDMSGDLRVGDYLMPFVKTPANVISTGLDYAGMGIPKALFTTVKAIRSGDLGEREVQQAIGRDLVRAGMGLTAAAVIVANLKPEDFMGAYDPARAQIEELRGSNTNSVRIGGKWISLDWFGPLSVPMTAQLYAKTYGHTTADKAVQYGEGMKSVLLNLPGVKEVTDYGKQQAYAKSQGQTAQQAKQSATNYVITQASSRLVPSFIGDVAKGTDQYQRESAKGVGAVKANIPGSHGRESLPIKRNVFGEPMKSEGAGSQILFGSRVKTDKDNPLLKEVAAVSKATGKNVNFTDWNKSSASGITQFKQKVGPKEADKAGITYGQTLKKNLQNTVTSDKYKQADDETKLALINKADADAQKTVFSQYNFKPERKKSLLHK